MRPFGTVCIVATPGTPPTTNWDKAAIALSALCLVHCLAIPFALLLGTATSQWLLDTETQMHWLLLGLAAPLSVFTLWHGYKKHKGKAVLYFGCSGLVLMLVGVSHILGDRLEIVLTAIGVSLVLVAHVKNLTLNHSHAHTSR